MFLEVQRDQEAGYLKIILRALCLIFAHPNAALGADMTLWGPYGDGEGPLVLML